MIKPTIDELEKEIKWVIDNNKEPYPYLIALRIKGLLEGYKTKKRMTK